MVSMHIHAKFLHLFLINFYVKGTVVPRTITVSLLTLKKLCFTFFNFVTDLNNARELFTKRHFKNLSSQKEFATAIHLDASIET